MEKNKLPYRKSGFNVPKDYFEALDERIMQSVHSSESKEKPVPKKASPFTVPEDYFETFEEQLFLKIEQEEKPSKVIKLFSRERYYYIAAVAAVFIAIVTTTFFNPQPVTINSIESIALEHYIDETLSTTDIVEIMEGEEVLPPPKEVKIDRGAILEYLQENLEETAIIFNN